MLKYGLIHFQNGLLSEISFLFNWWKWSCISFTKQINILFLYINIFVVGPDLLCSCFVWLRTLDYRFSKKFVHERVIAKADEFSLYWCLFVKNSHKIVMEFWICKNICFSNALLGLVKPYYMVYSPSLI